MGKTALVPDREAMESRGDAGLEIHANPLPQVTQKRTPAGLRVPQRLQLRPATPVSSEWPHEVQKRSSARLGRWQVGHVIHDSGPAAAGPGLRGTATAPVPSGEPQDEQKRCCGGLGAPHFAQSIAGVAARPAVMRGAGPGMGIWAAIASLSASAMSVACWKRSEGLFPAPSSPPPGPPARCAGCA